MVRYRWSMAAGSARTGHRDRHNMQDSKPAGNFPNADSHFINGEETCTFFMALSLRPQKCVFYGKPGKCSGYGKIPEGNTTL